MIKYILNTIVKVDITCSTVVIFESEEESLPKILEETLNSIWGEGVYTEEFLEGYSEFESGGIHCCGFDLDLEGISYLLTKLP